MDLLRVAKSRKRRQLQIDTLVLVIVPSDTFRGSILLASDVQAYEEVEARKGFYYKTVLCTFAVSVSQSIPNL